MTDFSLARLEKLPVTILIMGLMYCKNQRIVGQRGDTVNLVDLASLPLTPIMGDGSAPIQPLEVLDAAERIAFLALSQPSDRPMTDLKEVHRQSSLVDPWTRLPSHRSNTLRVYDAVGPEKMSMLEMLQYFARFNNNKNFRPVFVDYRNFERVLNVASLGNLNRQFVSLLRSEQDARQPVVGNPAIFEKLLGPSAKLSALSTLQTSGKRRFLPLQSLFVWVIRNPAAIPPGAALSIEIIGVALFGSAWYRWRASTAWQRANFCFLLSTILALMGAGLHYGSEFAVRILQEFGTDEGRDMKPQTDCR